ncbi:carbohydrate kinase family protein [Halococcus saccharolyticus]|uniref:PfkB domain-containing protein n=1 Tax=Halococcus saccharolyticus DSM 5350 TaxID=1227455 RepID=M0MI12_9EURY|nr:carbohydrate kinase [Halococcus saccharolyticus]EMA44978.1 PfkB domain-containing protein [Halococcus saccharolyticus DSM 5350]
MDDPAILVAGETLIDFLPAQPGPLSEVESFSRRAGGAAANVAIALSRFDASPWFLTNVSTDGFGDFLAAILDENGLPGRFVTRSAHPTTLAFVAHDADADRSFTFYGADSADSHLDADVVPDSVLDHIEWICVDAPVALAAEPARSALLDLCERARDHDCRVAFDPNTRRELWPDDVTLHETLDAVFARTDVVKTSVEDLGGTSFADDDPTDLAANLFAAGPHTVFLTRGADGSRAIAADRAPWGAVDVSHPGYDVDPVDATGAGDAFLAGVLHELAGGESLDETLAFANAVAALTTTETGAIDALPDHEAVTALRDACPE